MKKSYKLVRAAALCLAVTIFVSLFATTNVSAATPSFVKDEEWEVLRLTNNERSNNGLHPLSIFPSLHDAASVRASETVQLFSHTRPDGTSCFTAIDVISYGVAGENIAAGQRDPAAAVTAWMNSEGHRANILDSRYRHLGTGYVKTDSDYRNYWSQMFVGGCTTTGISIEGSDSINLSYGEDIRSRNLMLKVTCNLHGASYMPLDNAACTYDTNTLGYGKLKVTYDGFTIEVPCYVNFKDVPVGSWYGDAVRYVTENGLFNGTSAANFSPNRAMTRAMFVTVLYRMENSPAAGGNPFADVPWGEWYTDAVSWASEKNIIVGKSSTRFDPDGVVTREQIATLLYRYDSWKFGAADETRGGFDGFNDGYTVSPYALEGLRWTIGHSIMKGKTDGSLAPGEAASRAEVATILMRYLGIRG